MPQDLSVLARQVTGVTFVLHGFNNDQEDGERGTSGFVSSVRQQIPSLSDTTFVGVLWPGDSHIGFLSYPVEESDADNTATAFADTLASIAFPQPPHFVAHSLGCRVVLQTLDLLANRDSDRMWADQIVLLAAAVDNDSLARGDRYVDGVENVTRVVNVASKRDAVLRYAFPAGDFLAGIFRGGYTRTALGRAGPASKPRPPVNVRPIQIAKSENVGHGDYLVGKNLKQVRAARLSGRALTRYEPLQF